MSSGEFIAALAANFIVAGAAYYLKGPSFGAVCLGAGFVLMIVAYLLRKKKPEAQSPPPQTITQTQEFNPQFNPQFNPSIQIGFPPPTEREKSRTETLIVEFLKQYRKPDRSLPQPLSVIVEGTRRSDPRLTELDIAEALKSLCIKELIVRKPMEIEGGYMYWLL